MGRFADTFVDEEPQVSASQTSTSKNRFSDTFIESDRDLDLDNFTYDKFRQSPTLRRSAVRFAKAHLGYDNPSAEKAIDETIEHFREFNVNELTAAGDFNYVSGLKADAEDTGDYVNPKAAEALQDYKKLYEAFDALPNFGGGSAPGAFVDYAAGLLLSLIHI